MLPLTSGTSPETVEIANLGGEVYRREKEPVGFAMFHVTIVDGAGREAEWIVYLSPVVSSLCQNIAEKYECEPCRVPARDEPNIAFVFGDPRTMGQLRTRWTPTRWW